MRKIFIKVIAIVLCFATLFTTACDSSCGKKDNDAGNVQIAQTSHDLIANGISTYKVVISDNPQGYESYAAEQFVEYFAKATAADLPIVNESDVTYSKDSKLIVIGQTDLTEGANVSASKSEYGGRGFVIKTIDTNVFLIGGDTNGTLYAVYEFMHQEFGFEPYALDEEYIDTGVLNKKLLAFDMKEIPDIAYVNGIGPYWHEKNSLQGHKLRYLHYNEIFIHATGQPWHNTSEYVPPEVYNNPDDAENYHPKWFVEGGEGQSLQLHYTAHGDSVELKALQDVVYNRIINEIEEDFAQGLYYEYIGFMQNDSEGTFASSDGSFLADNDYNRGKNPDEVEFKDSIKELKKKYGENEATAASLIQFINPVAKRVQEYLNNHSNPNYKGRKMNITIFAYLDTEAAPVKNQNGEWVPIDDSVILEPNVNVFTAYIRDQYSLDFEENNMSITSEKWSALSSQTSFWFYDYYWENQFILMDNIYSLQTYFTGAKNNKAVYVFNESTTSDICSFQNLKVYLTAKLTWDTELNVDKLIDAYFENYYKDAAVTMRKYFDELITYYAYLKNNTDFTGVGSVATVSDSKYWPLGVLNSFTAYIEQAYKDIEPLKSVNPDLYAKLSKRILIDSIMPRYIKLLHYGEELYNSDAAYDAAVTQFKTELYGLGITTQVDSVIFSR